MKKNFRSSWTKKICFTLILLGFVATMNSCKKEKGPTGNFMFYTMLDSDKFDAIKVYVDSKQVGEITLSHIQRPECGTPTSINVVNVSLPTGKHTWYAKQFLKGQEIDEWYEREETIKEGECNFIKLVD